MITAILIVLSAFGAYHLGKIHAGRVPVIIGAGQWQPQKTALLQASEAVLCAYTLSVPVAQQVDLDSVLLQTIAGAGLARGEDLQRFKQYLVACVPERIRPTVSGLRLKPQDEMAYLVLALEVALWKE